jgi:hypothetical protein
MSGDRARVSVAIAVEPALAFQLFTEDIDRWSDQLTSLRQLCTDPRS